MTTYDNLYENLCAYNNLYLAYKKARKHKTKKHYVINFETNLHQNLRKLRLELLFHVYKPKPLINFTIRDPKTRKISKSDFIDRIVHHAVCNILEPIYQKIFIYDSFANQKGKGTLIAIKRFNKFKRKVSKNNTNLIYILKCDIKKYFETVDHEILLNIIKKSIKDEKVIWLIKQILNNYNLGGGARKKGMPLGNLTSQFFANVYLNELDYFVKHKLRIKYYIRYVDDFVILHENKAILEQYKKEISKFLINNLRLNLHPEKSKIKQLNQGIDFLGFRLFYYHKLLKKRNLKHFKSNLFDPNQEYNKLYLRLEGFLAYSKHASTFKLRKRLINDFESNHQKLSDTEVNRYLKTKSGLDGI